MKQPTDKQRFVLYVMYKRYRNNRPWIDIKDLGHDRAYYAQSLPGLVKNGLAERRKPDVGHVAPRVTHRLSCKGIELMDEYRAHGLKLCGFERMRAGLRRAYVQSLFGETAGPAFVESGLIHWPKGVVCGLWNSESGWPLAMVAAIGARAPHILQDVEEEASP